MTKKIFSKPSNEENSDNDDFNEEENIFDDILRTSLKIIS